MLQSAIGIVHCIEHEQIVLLRRFVRQALACRRAVPETNFGLANTPGVRQQLFTIKCGRGTGHHQAVAHAARDERAAPEPPHLHRAVDQFIVVGGLVAAKAKFGGFDGLQCGRHLPATQRLVARDLQHMGQELLAVYTQEQAGAVEKTAARIQPGAAHRVVERIHLVTHQQRRSRVAGDFPVAFVQLHQGQRMAALDGTQSLKVFGKLAHQITAGYPDRQTQALQGGRLGDRERDTEQVGVQVGDLNPVVDARKCARTPVALGGVFGGARQTRFTWHRPGIFPPARN